MLVFVLGGVKSGKSMFSQCAAKYLHKNTNGKLIYLATMIPYDREDELRIKRHINDRQGWGFETLEEGIDFKNILGEISSEDTVLMDSVTSYVQNNMFNEKSAVEVSSEKLAEGIISCLTKTLNAVIVSDYIFSEACETGEGTAKYSETLGAVHRYIASAADVLVECASSNIKLWKNNSGFDLDEIMKQFNALDNHLHYNDI